MLILQVNCRSKVSEICHMPDESITYHYTIITVTFTTITLPSILVMRYEHIFIVRSSFKMLPESLCFREIRNRTIIQNTFPSKYSPCANIHFCQRQ
jgi:hypothetical protein